MDDNNTIICRCSDLTRGQIREYVNSGISTVDEIKRLSRLGMGPCQGRTCIPLVMREIADMKKVPIADLTPGTYRPPVKAIKMGEILEALEEGASK